MNSHIPFNQRFGVAQPDRPIDEDFPKPARTGVLSILAKLEAKNRVPSWSSLATEALHTARRLKKEYPDKSSEDICEAVLYDLSWDRVYMFCEKVFRVLQPAREYDDSAQDFSRPPEYQIIETLEDSQSFFTRELNELLAEENLAYEFSEGMFQRRGRPHTQKMLQRVGMVLGEPKYVVARKHYNKAKAFFSERPAADVENCIKEAICALEAFVETLFGHRAAKSFDETLRTKQGNAEGEIPPTIVESIIKLRAFRGNAKGVAHAAIQGDFVSEIEAELVLSLVASYITYLRDRFPPSEEKIPF